MKKLKVTFLERYLNLAIDRQTKLAKQSKSTDDTDYLNSLVELRDELVSTVDPDREQTEETQKKVEI